MYALVDCNSFYVSCERLFRPDLNTQPVVVLSNNDGCVVSRSTEAKQLDIKMGVPFFEVREHVERGRLFAFSSNYALYGDISERVMTTLEEMVPEIEIYSIDEAFLDMSGLETLDSLHDFGHRIKTRIPTWIGIPVGVGIAPTKTLAKLANHAAKHYPKTMGVVVLDNERWRERLLKITAVNDVWGVGRRLSAKLNAEGVMTAYDLANANPDDIAKRYSVVLKRTVLELQGTACITFNEQPQPKQQILCSRTFSSRITSKRALREALSEYAMRAAEKLRLDKQLTSNIAIYIRTNPKDSFAKRYANRICRSLPYPTNDSCIIMQTAVQLLDSIYREGYRYMKAGIMLNDLQLEQHYQTDLFCQPFNAGKSAELMRTLDSINRKYARGVYFAAQGVEQPWSMNRRYLSPSYTTNWSCLPKVK